MWIRTQDGESLINVNRIEITGYDTMFTNAIWGEGFLLGKYSTKEKALKVLDFIEKKIIENNNAIVCDNERYVKYFVKNAGNNNQVLHMPLESEVEE